MRYTGVRGWGGGGGGGGFNGFTGTPLLVEPPPLGQNVFHFQGVLGEKLEKSSIFLLIHVLSKINPTFRNLASSPDQISKTVKLHGSFLCNL